MEIKVGVIHIITSIMFEKIFGRKQENADDKPVSEEELAALGIKKGISMTRPELDAHLAMMERKKSLGDVRGQGETPAMTPEEIERAEAALARNQEIGGK